MKRMPLHCSFCGQAQDDVAVMIKGPETAECSHNICDECVGACLAVIGDYIRSGATKLRHFIEQGSDE